MTYQFITKDYQICRGKPIFKGTRIPVYLILEMLGAGETFVNIINNYPQLTEGHILEAMKIAAESLKMEEEEIELSH